MLTPNVQLHFLDAGLLPYEEALLLQHKLHARCVASNGRSAFVLRVEHPAVLTLGKHASEANFLVSASELLASGVAIVRTDRGGEVTAHMPGQLVVYPILPLGQIGLSVRSYISILEQTIIDLLKDFGLTATRSVDFPGVWIDDAKVCAVGVRIKQRISLHGLALNINNRLDLFGKIVPCGIRGRAVTSLANASGRPVHSEQVWEKYKTIFAGKLALPFMDTGLKDLLET